jgi:hypothetical protein
LEDTGTFGLDALCVAEMDSGWRVEAETGVAVLVVVPAKETLAECTSVLNGAKLSRKLWSVFEGLEVCF